MRDFDARGMICPVPVLRARKILLSMQPGEKLRVTATDPAAPKDFELFCGEAGHTLHEVTDSKGVFTVIVECGA